MLSKSPLALISVLMLLSSGCKKAEEAGFGGEGAPLPAPPIDTSPPESDGDSGGDSGPDSGLDTGPSGDSDTSSSGKNKEEGIPEGSGYEEGDQAYDLQARDAADAIWTLHSAYGQRILLAFGDGYDSTFTSNVSVLAALEADSEVESLHAAAAMILGPDTSAASRDDVTDLALSTGLGRVLYSLASEDQALWAPTRPKLYVIDSGMQIQQVLYGAVTEDSLRSILSELSDG